MLFLDAQHRLIALEEMFRGTLTQTSVYPREVVKRALALNAGAVILAHNHPSGVAEPSRADEFLTQTLKSALALVDVRVLDHLVVGRGRWCRSPSGGCCEQAPRACTDLARAARARLRQRRAPRPPQRAGRASAARAPAARSASADAVRRTPSGPVHAAARPRPRAEPTRRGPRRSRGSARPTSAPRCARRCPTRSTSNRCCSPTTA